MALQLSIGRGRPPTAERQIVEQPIEEIGIVDRHRSVTRARLVQLSPTSASCRSAVHHKASVRLVVASRVEALASAASRIRRRPRRFRADLVVSSLRPAREPSLEHDGLLAAATREVP